MKNAMTYKGYAARIEFDERDNIFIGKLLGVNDLVNFRAENVVELHAAFESAVDDYLETCRKIDKTPDKPRSGRLMLRVPPEVHRAALIAAQASGVSLNKWAAKVMREAARG